MTAKTIKLLSFLKIQLIISWRWLSFLFKRNKKLKKIEFSYYKYWHFDNAFLIVNFLFENVLYFKIGKKKYLELSRPVIINLQRENVENIKIEIIGFRQKQDCLVEVNKQMHLATDSFNTKPNKAKLGVILQAKPKITLPNFIQSVDKLKIGLSNLRPNLSIQSFSIHSKRITVNNNKFNTQDYI